MIALVKAGSFRPFLAQRTIKEPTNVYQTTAR
jgi:hypothetical protein